MGASERHLEATERHFGGRRQLRDTLEASWRHPPQVFPPSLSKDNCKLNIDIYHFVVHGTQEIFQSVSKESESMVLKQQKTHVWGSILRCFWARERPWEHPGDHAEIETLQSIKRPLFWTLFLEHIYDRCCICFVFLFVLQCFPNPTFASFLVSEAATHTNLKLMRVQF